VIGDVRIVVHLVSSRADPLTDHSSTAGHDSHFA
jgi:hypothetical protein